VKEILSVHQHSETRRKVKKIKTSSVSLLSVNLLSLVSAGRCSGLSSWQVLHSETSREQRSVSRIASICCAYFSKLCLLCRLLVSKFYKRYL
jgi:hypothetical protein